MQRRISTLSIGSARSPSRLSTGSPGMRCTSRNTSTETPKTAVRLETSRRRRKLARIRRDQNGVGLGAQNFARRAEPLSNVGSGSAPKRAGAAALVAVAAVAVGRAAAHAPVALGRARARSGPTFMLQLLSSFGLVADAAIVGVRAVGAAERNGFLRRVAGFVGDRREEADAHGLARAGRRRRSLLACNSR